MSHWPLSFFLCTLCTFPRNRFDDDNQRQQQRQLQRQLIIADEWERERKIFHKLRRVEDDVEIVEATCTIIQRQVSFHIHIRERVYIYSRASILFSYFILRRLFCFLFKTYSHSLLLTLLLTCTMWIFHTHRLYYT